MIRARHDSDDGELLALYDGDVPQLLYERVLVEDGKIVGHAGVRMVPEAVLVLSKSHPASRMRWLRLFHVELLAWMNEAKQNRVICLFASKIEKAFLRRLRSLGWHEGCQTAILLSEDEDEGQRR